MDAREVAAFICARLPALPAPGVGEIVIHTAQADSGIGRLTEMTLGGSPYWAYPWAGGLALARHILDHPQAVRGKSVLDLGAGSGLVGIAALKAGAGSVIFCDADTSALVASRLNAERNGGVATAFLGDILDLAPPEVDVILAGDAFYAQKLARRVGMFLDRARQAGIRALIGDPGRKHLPLHRLQLLATYEVEDLGESNGEAGVYAWE